MRNVYLLVIALFACTLTSFSQVTSTAVGGDWSNPATWNGGVVPAGTDDVIIADGAIVTLDVNANVVNLTVGQGVDGILQYESINPQTLTVDGNVIINTGAIFRSSNAGNQAGHVLSVAGSLINDGSLMFSTNANTAGVRIIFTGATNTSFGGIGIVTDISLITIDKGISAASILELNTSEFTFKGESSTPGTTPGFLDIINGTFKISGTFIMDNGLFTGTNNYTVPPSGGLWFNNPNFTVNARAGTAYMEGRLQVDAGTYNVGTQINNRLGYIAGTTVIINGGVVNVASRFSATTTYGLTYLQTGGVFTVNTVGSTSNGFASFDMRNIDPSSFTMSGGSIVIQNASLGTGGPRDYFNNAGSINILGGTLQIGNALTSGAQTFYLSGSAPDLVIDNSVPGNVARLTGNLSVIGNTTITATSTLVLDNGTVGFTFTQLGPNFTNSGTLDGSNATSVLSFSGNTAQTYGGDGLILAPLANLVMNNAAGLSITNLIPSELPTLALSMFSGDINTGVSTLTIGSSIAVLGTVNYVSGTVIGKFKKWKDATTGNTDFQVGIAGSTRTASIDFTTAPSTGGTLTASWVPAYGGTNGLPVTEPGYPATTDVASDGYWTITADDGLTDGVYTGTYFARNVGTVIDFSQLVLVKRADAVSPWTLDGTHVATTGSNTNPILSRTGMVGFSDFGIGGSTTSLPITVEYFKGKKQGTGNLLDWKVTCTNTPTATMNLERSNDSRKFTKINEITATSLRCLQPFNFIDASPNSGLNYYRLKLTDADGKSTYSNIIALLNEEKGFSITSLSPNPVRTSTIITIASATNSKMEIVVTDISGKKVFSRSVSLIAGSNQVGFDFSNLASGSYQVTGFTQDGGAKTTQFIKN